MQTNSSNISDVSNCQLNLYQGQDSAVFFSITAVLLLLGIVGNVANLTGLKADVEATTVGSYLRILAFTQLLFFFPFTLLDLLCRTEPLRGKNCSRYRFLVYGPLCGFLDCFLLLLVLCVCLRVRRRLRNVRLCALLDARPMIAYRTLPLLMVFSAAFTFVFFLEMNISPVEPYCARLSEFAVGEAMKFRLVRIVPVVLFAVSLLATVWLWHMNHCLTEQHHPTTRIWQRGKSRQAHSVILTVSLLLSCYAVIWVLQLVLLLMPHSTTSLLDRALYFRRLFSYGFPCVLLTALHGSYRDELRVLVSDCGYLLTFCCHTKSAEAPALLLPQLSADSGEVVRPSAMSSSFHLPGFQKAAPICERKSCLRQSSAVGTPQLQHRAGVSGCSTVRFSVDNVAVIC